MLNKLRHDPTRLLGFITGHFLIGRMTTNGPIRLTHTQSPGSILQYLALSCFIVLSTINIAHAQSRGGGGTSVETDIAKTQQASTNADIQGQILSSMRHGVIASRAGMYRLEEIEIGDRVEKGTLIARLDTDDLVFQRDQAKIQYRDAELRLNESKDSAAAEKESLSLLIEQRSLLQLRAERAAELSRAKALSTEAAETAQNAYLSVRQQVLNKENAIRRLTFQIEQNTLATQRLSGQIANIEQKIDEAALRAPASGQIVRLNPLKQGFARQGDILAEIQSADDYEILAQIPSGYLRFLRSAGDVAISYGGGPARQARLRVIEPEENQRTGTRPVRFTPIGSVPRLAQADGAVVKLSIPTRPAAPVVTVPQDAVVPVSGGHVVFVAKDGKASRQIVKLGGPIGGDMIILSGIKAGDKVVVRGNEGLSNGTAIREKSDEKPKTAADAPKLAADAKVWKLDWTTNRGPGSAELTLSSGANLYEGTAIEVVRDGDKISFVGERMLPFGPIQMVHEGVISGDKMTGSITMKGLPNGREPKFDFSGAVK